MTMHSKGEKLMKMFVLIGVAFGLIACQPQQVNQAAQQQHFVCKSLIEGFLKAQHFGEYQLEHLQPTLQKTAAIRQYTYHVSNDEKMKINMPAQKNLNFQCQQTSAQHFEIHLINSQQISQDENPRLKQQPLLSLELPPHKASDTLTTFVLKNQ